MRKRIIVLMALCLYTQASDSAADGNHTFSKRGTYLIQTRIDERVLKEDPEILLLKIYEGFSIEATIFAKSPKANWTEGMRGKKFELCVEILEPCLGECHGKIVGAIDLLPPHHDLELPTQDGSPPKPLTKKKATEICKYHRR